MTLTAWSTEFLPMDKSLVRFYSEQNSSLGFETGDFFVHKGVYTIVRSDTLSNTR